MPLLYILWRRFRRVRTDRSSGERLWTRPGEHASCDPPWSTRLIWIANPNNPTETLLPYPQLKAFLHAMPSDVVVVLDEAYNEYIPPSERADTTAWLTEFPNLVLTRTFSKIYGLAGLRIGYALASSAIADLMNRVRQPFNCNNLALAAATAALDDHEFVAACSYALNRAGMEQIVTGLKHFGFSHLPSHGNFVTFKAGDAAALGKQSEPAQTGGDCPSDWWLRHAGVVASDDWYRDSNT